MSMGTQRKLSMSAHSIDDYPEHLNPFHEDDNHNKIRFWTIGRKRERSQSFSLAGLKDLRSTWSFKSFMKKGRRDSVTPTLHTTNASSAASSPIVYRKHEPVSETSYNGFSRSTVMATPADRYNYGGSMTPLALPRSRFRDRVSHLDQTRPTPNQLRPEDAINQAEALSTFKSIKMNGSTLSVESDNAFGNSPVRASMRKKRQAPPPPLRTSTPTIAVKVTESTIESVQNVSLQSTKFETEIDIDDPSYNVELKIVEENDILPNEKNNAGYPETVASRVEINDTKKEPDLVKPEKIDIGTIYHVKDDSDKQNIENDTAPISYSKENPPEKSSANKEVTICPEALFPKIDICIYKRQESLDASKSTENLEEISASNSSEQMRDEKSAKEITKDELDLPKSLNDITITETKDIIPNGVSSLKSNPTNKNKIMEINSTMKDFLDIDKATQELEIEIKKLNQEMETMNEKKPEFEKESYKRKTVSDMKLLFDGSSDPNIPNPIPKPRRSRISVSSIDSNKLSPTHSQKTDENNCE